MIKRAFTGIFFSVLQLAVLAQAPVKFRKVIGTSGYDDGYSVQQTYDKGYIIGGATSSFGDGSTDMYYVKTDSMGIPRKHGTIGGINIDRGYSIRQTADSGYIFLGYTDSYGAGGYDLYLVKMDTGFSIEWAKTYGGADWDFGNAVKQTADGGFILCGSTYSYGAGDQDYYLVKTDAAGDTLWTKTYGGAGADIAKAVIQSADGGYVITGTTKSYGDTLGDIYTVRTNAFGDTLWTSKFGLPGRADYGNDVIESLSHHFLVAGETSSYDTAASDAVALELSATGAITYIETDGLPGTADSYNSITQDTLGRIAMAGTTHSFGANGDAYLVICDSTWGFFNATTFGSLEFDGVYSIDHTADKCFVLCGITNSFNNNLDDIYLVKTDTFGLASVPESVFVTGVQEHSAGAKGRFSLFPNPADGTVYLHTGNSAPGEEYRLLITDVLGRVVQQRRLGGGTQQLNTADLADGIYWVTLQNEHFSASQKLIVQH